jgi:excisionase family DNA binding protein
MAEIVVLTREQVRELVQLAVREELERAKGGDLVDAAGSGLSKRTFRRLVREGKLDGKKVGRAYQVKRQSLEAYLAQRDAPTLVNNESDADEVIREALDAGRLRVVAK